MDYLYSLDFTQLIKQSEYTWLLIFGIAFLETLLLVGFFFPGSVALLAIGGLIASGTLELWPTLFWAFLGAVIGDNISFWIGVYFKEPLHHSRLYARHKEAFLKGEEFFHQYGTYSVVLGRFVGPIRAVIPTIAGSLGMSGKLFFVVNVLSALVWAPAYILPGYLMGDLYKHLDQYLEIQVGSLLTILAALIVIGFMIKRSQHHRKDWAYTGLVLITLLALGLTQIRFPW